MMEQSKRSHGIEPSPFVYVSNGVVMKSSDFLVKKRLMKIPERFREASLEADSSCSPHPRFCWAAEILKREPLGSYALTGRFGSGKTYLLYALYRVVSSDPKRKIFLFRLGELIDSLRRSVSDPEYVSPIQPELLQTQEPMSLFLDDIDKCRPTSFAAERLYSIVNLFYERNQQVVVTSNLSLKDLAQFWNGIDSIGGAIARRLSSLCLEIIFE
ncbi:MAG: DnaA ATPase domain-containing protein [bacterium JZ-2024 1]